MIRLHNSRTRRKEDFTPIDPQNVRMYVCGPTVYDRAHLGNARPVVVFDVLYRLLRHVYGEGHVTYVRNFTDVDDKINARAAQMQADGDGRSLNEIIHALTDETIDWYHADMDALGALRPTHAPRATEYIVQMVDMIETLIKKGFAYEKQVSYGHNSRAVYFNSKKAPAHTFFSVNDYNHYGEFSGRSLDDMLSGSRAEEGEGKENKMDFVLWKPSTVDEPGWESPWGLGRPGWHIECSAMSKALLGKTFDIHGGGLDLQFPHHENEIAQSCCANDTSVLANYWLHNEMVQVEGKKMSKSLGNFFTVRDLLEQGWPGEVIRFVMLSTHYRKPMDWTEEKASQALRELNLWLPRASDELSFMTTTVKFDHDLLAEAPDMSLIHQEVIDALSDDLNTSLALTKLVQLARRADNVQLYTTDAEQLVEKRRLIATAFFLGFNLKEMARKSNASAPVKDLSSFEMELVYERAKAKENGDYSVLDRLKAALIATGLEVQMSKERVKLIPGPNFDPSKLDALK